MPNNRLENTREASKTLPKPDYLFYQNLEILAVIYEYLSPKDRLNFSLTNYQTCFNFYYRAYALRAYDYQTFLPTYVNVTSLKILNECGVDLIFSKNKINFLITTETGPSSVKNILGSIEAKKEGSLSQDKYEFKEELKFETPIKLNKFYIINDYFLGSYTDGEDLLKTLFIKNKKISSGNFELASEPMLLDDKMQFFSLNAFHLDEVYKGVLKLNSSGFISAQVSQIKFLFELNDQIICVYPIEYENRYEYYCRTIKNSTYRVQNAKNSTHYESEFLSNFCKGMLITNGYLIQLLRINFTVTTGGKLQLKIKKLDNEDAQEKCVYLGRDSHGIVMMVANEHYIYVLDRSGSNTYSIYIVAIQHAKLINAFQFAANKAKIYEHDNHVYLLRKNLKQIFIDQLVFNEESATINSTAKFSISNFKILQVALDQINLEDKPDIILKQKELFVDCLCTYIENANTIEEILKLNDFKYQYKIQAETNKFWDIVSVYTDKEKGDYVDQVRKGEFSSSRSHTQYPLWNAVNNAASFFHIPKSQTKSFRRIQETLKSKVLEVLKDPKELEKLAEDSNQITILSKLIDCSQRELENLYPKQKRRFG